MTSGIEAPPELPDSMSPEAGSDTPTPEKIFGKEVLTPDDVRKISQNIHGLLEENSSASVYQAARQLAHMKRAGFEMKHDSKQRAYMLEKLNGQMDSWRKAQPRDHARYLTFLKYISAGHDEGFRLSDEDHQLVVSASERAMNEGDGETSASLRVMRRYLVGPEDVDSRKTQEEELSRVVPNHIKQQAAEGKFVGAAVNVGRMKYLQAKTGLDRSTEQSIIKGAEQAVENRTSRGEWRNCASLRNLIGYIGGTARSLGDGRALSEIADYIKQRKPTKSKTSFSRNWDTVVAEYADAKRLQDTYRTPSRANESQSGGDEEAAAANAARETLTGRMVTDEDVYGNMFIDDSEEVIVLEDGLDDWSDTSDDWLDTDVLGPEDEVTKESEDSVEEEVDLFDDDDDEPASVSTNVGEYGDLELPEDMSNSDVLDGEEVLGESETVVASADATSIDQTEAYEARASFAEQVAAFNKKKQEQAAAAIPQPVYTAAEDAEAKKIMKVLQQGGDISDAYDAHMQAVVLATHPVADPRREACRQKYLGIWQNELGRLEGQKSRGFNRLLHNLTSSWIEKVYARTAVVGGPIAYAKAYGRELTAKVKQLSKAQPARSSLRLGVETILAPVTAWSETRKSRQLEMSIARRDTINSMRRAASNESVDGETRAFLNRLAQELLQGGI